MTKGAKIAIGCAFAAVGVFVALGVGVLALGYCAKRRIHEATADLEQISEYQKQANANPFTRPADGVVQEDRFVKFLNVRKAVYEIYGAHKSDFEERAKKKEAGLGDVLALTKLFKDIKLAQVKAQAAEGMSDDEYRFMVESVYKTAWAAELAKSTGGRSASQVTEESLKRADEEMANAEREKNMPPEVRQALREAREKAASTAPEARARAAEMDVPAANLELFKKYEADIKKYAMTGLEAAGL